jgi:S-adenosylmethionine uptake transporter
VFGEKLTVATIGGTLLIVAGCLMAARRRPATTAQEVEPALQ